MTPGGIQHRAHGEKTTSKHTRPSQDNTSQGTREREKHEKNTKKKSNMRERWVRIHQITTNNAAQSKVSGGGGGTFPVESPAATVVS